MSAYEEGSRDVILGLRALPNRDREVQMWVHALLQTRNLFLWKVWCGAFFPFFTFNPQLRQDTLIYPSAAWCLASLDLLEGAVARKT